jgi:hypothetical protein
MPELKSLNATNLPEGHDLATHGEKPLVNFVLDKNKLEISYIFPGIIVSEQKNKVTDNRLREMMPADLHEVGIAGIGFFSESGKPLLPSFGRFVQIPPGCNFKIHVAKSEPVEYQDMKIKPAQENRKDQDAGTVEFDENAYNQDQFYPGEVIERSRPMYMDGYRVICIHIRPLQYNPKRKLLHAYSNIKVTIELLPGKTVAGQEADTDELDNWVFSDRSKSLEGFGNLIFNPSRSYFEKSSVLRLPVTQMRARPDIPEYYIIYGDVFEKPAQKLAEWKQKKGIETQAICIDAIIGSEKGDFAKLKDFIRAKRGEPFSPLRYVLLFGDVAHIPTSGDAGSTTDHYFFTHRDRDAKDDSDCIIPWISGGRIPARSEQEGMSIVDQIIHYEKNPPHDREYYNRMTVAAYFQDVDESGMQNGRADMAYMKTMESIRDHMLSHGFKVNRVYVSNNRNPREYIDGTPVPMKVKESILYKRNGGVATKRLVGYVNEGQLIVGHRGHGGKDGWANPAFKNTDVKTISSQQPSIFFSINCLTGSFDRQEECFAEAILALNGGAPSLIAATELSGSWRNDSMIKALYDAIWPGAIPTYPVTTMRYPIKYYRMGDILNYSKAYLLTAHGSNPNTRKQFEIYHVIGDPTLNIWGEEPLTLRLRASISKDMLILNMNTCPRDAVLSIWYGKIRLKRLEPTGTRLAIPLMLFQDLPKDALNPARAEPYALSIYFSAPGHRFAESKLWF